MSLAVLTDSTACLPPAAAQAEGITVLPLHVGVGSRSYAEGVEITAAQVAALLTEGKERVTTSRPAPGEFAQAYRDLAGTGATEVISLHLSEQISGTVEAARLAAAEVADEVTVHVVDTEVLGMALGYAARTAAHQARSGAGAAATIEAVRRRVAASSTVFYLDSLEHLRRGGRVGTAQALLGQALAVKPLLTLRSGQVELWEKVRTRSRAMARLTEHAAQAVGTAAREYRTVAVAVQHLAWAEPARELAERLGEQAGAEVDLIELGAVTAVHTGPRTLAVVISPDPAQRRS